MLPRSLHQPVENATLHYLDRLHAWNVRLPGAGLAGISFVTLSAKIINSVCIETSSRNIYADWIRSWRWIWFLFCVECNNFIFNETIEQVYMSCILYTEEKSTRFQGIYRASRLLWHLRFSQCPKCSDNHILLGFQMNKKPQLLRVLSRFPVKVRLRTLGFLSKSPQNQVDEDY